MNRFGVVAALALAGSALGGVLAPQAAAQQQVAVMPGDVPGEYRALGVVTVEVHQKTVFAKVPMQQQLDDALRVEAAKLGADAVIQVKYETNSSLTSKKGNHATGVAVKFSRPTQMAAAAPAPAASAPAPAPAVAPHAPPAPAKSADPVAPPAAAPPAPALAAAPSFSATAPPVIAAAPAPTPAPVPAAPAAVRHASTPAMIVLTDQDLLGQRYVRLGEVSAVTHQTSLFPKTPAMETLKSALQGEAAKLGADAVIQVKYKMGNAMMSRDGNKATGIAVRFE